MRNCRFQFVPVMACLALVVSSARVRAEAPAKVNFDRQIRPLLSDNCSACHGFDEKQRKAGLRLDTREGILAPADSGEPAVIPGKGAESELYKRLVEATPELQMPPPSTGKTLKPEQIELIKRWIDEGAEVTQHWSFIPPTQPAPPAVTQPELVINPIDQFILKRLEQEGLKPSPQADKVTLIRRVTLDLTGLPPTPAEVDAFLADHSEKAYETVVERLLNSPRFGEHMARYWLDAARYGDTHGLHLDNERSLWPYRDWVIEAFNKNLPFDQFTLYQMAGDLLPNPTREQQVATGFNRCNITTGEGGSIDDELRVRYAVDRVETLGTVFLGMTLGCSVCHDHKYDPVTQKEFYQLYAFFNAASEQAMDGNVLLPPPLLKLPDASAEQKFKDLDAKIASLDSQINEAFAKYVYQEPALTADSWTGEQREHVWVDDAIPEGGKTDGSGNWEFVAAPDNPVLAGTKSVLRKGDGVHQHFFNQSPQTLRIGTGDKLFAYVYLDPANPPKQIMLQFHTNDWNHRAAWGTEDLIPFGQANTPSKVMMGPLPKAGEWVRLEVDVAAVGLPSGTRINGCAFTQHGGTAHWDKMGILTRSPQGSQGFDSLSRWIAFEASQEKSDVPKEVLDALKAEVQDRQAESGEQTQLQAAKQAIEAADAIKLAENATEEQKSVRDKRQLAARKTFEALQLTSEANAIERKDRRLARDPQIRNYFVRHVATQTRPIFDPLDQSLNQARMERKQLDDALPATMVFTDMPEPRETFILVRGEYDKKGEKVTAGTPGILPPLAADAPRNRLGLAKWLLDPQHPLVSRVIVNRFWQQYFGTGLVKTTEDFGTQGSRPSHPELLDWLATEFINTGWDMKGLQRKIVLSATYRQSSVTTPELVQKDPENLLLAHGPRFRLDAEVLRDSALFVSGTLIDQVGGKSVKTYQPEGIWEAVGFIGSNTRDFKQDHGTALYRRSMYTFWKRTAPPPSMLTFDAPSRETCTVRRARTNTPLQALVLMNDVQYMEAARHLAQRLIKEGGATPDERIDYGFRIVLGRHPRDDERNIVAGIFDGHLGEYKSNPDAAKLLLSYGESPRDESLDPTEHAAWTMVSNLLLNLDESITKE